MRCLLCMHVPKVSKHPHTPINWLLYPFIALPNTDGRLKPWLLSFRHARETKQQERVFILFQEVYVVRYERNVKGSCHRTLCLQQLSMLISNYRASFVLSASPWQQSLLVDDLPSQKMYFLPYWEATASYSWQSSVYPYSDSKLAGLLGMRSSVGHTLTPVKQTNCIIQQNNVSTCTRPVAGGLLA